MSVYVDDMRAPYGRMVMCHMLADTPEELWEMAGRLDLQARWAQHVGTYREHFDISLSKRAEAIRYGAVPVSVREVARLLANRREQSRG